MAPTTNILQIANTLPLCLFHSGIKNDVFGELFIIISPSWAILYVRIFH